MALPTTRTSGRSAQARTENETSPSDVTDPGLSILLENSQYSRIACGGVIFILAVVGNARWPREYSHYVNAMITALWTITAGSLVVPFSKNKFKKGWSVLTMINVMAAASTVNLLIHAINHVAYCSSNPCYPQSDRYFSRSVDGVFAALSIYLLCSSLVTTSNLWRGAEIKARSRNARNRQRATDDPEPPRAPQAPPYTNHAYTSSSLRIDQVTFEPPPSYEMSQQSESSADDRNTNDHVTRPTPARRVARSLIGEGEMGRSTGGNDRSQPV